VLAILLVLSAVFLLGHANNITEYGSTVFNIFTHATEDTGGYERLGELCNTFGSRLSGSQSLEDAIDWVVDRMQKDGFDSVTTEPVTVTKWVRRSEELKMTSPREKKMDILALGGSIGTGGTPITAEVLVVATFEELIANADKAVGKIVVFNAPFISYSQTVSYRVDGAVAAAKVGAVASLTRSVTPFSLYTPHTGVMYYEEGITQIPAAAITVEDAILLQTIQNNGETPVLSLFMDCETVGTSQSRNIIGDYRGSSIPDELVVIGGHIDSWDVGSGAHDDGGGIMHTWQAIRTLIALNLRPQRTIRLVMWTNEENGGAGHDAYFNDHINELNSTVFCYESDSGSFTPVGLSVSGTSVARNEVQQIADLMSPFVHLQITSGGAGADVSPLTNAGVPGAGLTVAADGVGQDTYFWYHHTRADTFDHIDLRELQLCVGTTASLAFVVADMESNLPRTPTM